MAAARPHPQRSRRRCRRGGADIGIALDGDADRLIVVDEKGQMVDGDQLMALIGSPGAARAAARATAWSRR